MGAEAAAVGPVRGWGTWEELILGGAVLRHGTRDWNVVALELRSRTLYPHSFTPEVCKAKYEDLQKRYSGSTAWFEELRKRRVAELKQELARSEDSIGSLESKIKSLEAEKQNSNHADYGSSQTESPVPAFNSDGTESFSKEISKDENSAGSFTKDTRTRTSWLCEREIETDAKPDVSVSSEQDKGGLSIEKKPAEAGYEKAVTIRKRRGQRKRKDCNQAVKEGSVAESDNNLCSSNIVSTTQKEVSTTDSDHINRVSGLNNHNEEGSHNVKRHNLMEIFQSLARSEPAVVFRHRMDSQKRARYRKVIKQHLDIGTIRSRITGQSIKSAKELFRDLLLLANNALVFYSRRTREYKSALSMRRLVMEEYKRHCRGSCQEATSAFLPFNHPPGRPRSARPRPPPPSKKDKVVVSEKLLNVENNNIVAAPANNPKPLEKQNDSDYNVKLNCLMKVNKKGLKKPGKGKPELLSDTRSKSSPPVRQRKRVRR